MKSRLVAALLGVVLLGGCGFEVQQPDLFLLTRTGPGGKLTMLVNYGGTISCNGAKTKSLPDSLLLSARDLAETLDNDAKAKLRIARSPDSVFFFTVRLQDGTISFPDTAAAKHSELAQTERFTLQAQPYC